MKPMVEIDKRILLGSGSPRRRQLLEMMDIEFEAVKLADVDETYPLDLPPGEVPKYLSLLKANAYAGRLEENDLLLTADTVVIAGGEILGKPTDSFDAAEMLRKLSGRTHIVATGVALTTRRNQRSFTETTLVEFNDLTDDDIRYYVEKYNPADKAGAYGIQEWIGLIGVKSITGCYFNVMGLPTAALYRELKRFATR